MRGFIVFGQESPESTPEKPNFLAKRVPIQGVVVHSRHLRDDPDQEYAAIVPVALLHPELNMAPDGGLWILDAQDYGILAYAVVWCYWSEEEDEERLREIQEFIQEESGRHLQRQRRRKQDG